MGNWTVKEVSGRFENWDTSEQFGNRFIVSIRLHHEPSIADRSAVPPAFTESPRLVWNENILFKDLNKNTFWSWEGDLYGMKPRAMTFSAWRNRYVEVWNRAAGQPLNWQIHRGSSALYVDSRLVTLRQIVEGSRHTERSRLNVQIERLRRPAVAPLPTIGWYQALMVRDFIQRNSCELWVEIVDLPGMAVRVVSPAQSMMRKERLLRFDCGVGGNRIRAHQRLRVDMPAGKGAWIRSAALGWAELTLPLVGYSLDPTSPDLLNPRQGEFDDWALHPGGFPTNAAGEFR